MRLNNIYFAKCFVINFRCGTIRLLNSECWIEFGHEFTHQSNKNVLGWCSLISIHHFILHADNSAVWSVAWNGKLLFTPNHCIAWKKRFSFFHKFITISRAKWTNQLMAIPSKYNANRWFDHHENDRWGRKKEGRIWLQNIYKELFASFGST